MEPELSKQNLPYLGLDFDPFTIFGESDDAWQYMARFVTTPDGLKVWALTITPKGYPAEGPPPEDVQGPGINTRILKAIRFPQIRQLMKKQTEEHLARALKEQDHAPPEDQPIIDKELVRARGEAAGAEPPTVKLTGRPPTSDDDNARLALDVLDYKDEHGYRTALRLSWIKREGRKLELKTVDSRMRRLRNDGWLIGYGKLATIGPQLKAWMESNPDSRPPEHKE